MPGLRELKAELLPEVDVLDQLIGQDGFCVAFSDQLTVVDNVGGLANIQSIANIVIGNQHANAFGLEVMNDLFDVAH